MYKINNIPQKRKLYLDIPHMRNYNKLIDTTDVYTKHTGCMQTNAVLVQSYALANSTHIRTSQIYNLADVYNYVEWLLNFTWQFNYTPFDIYCQQKSDKGNRKGGREDEEDI